MGFLQKFKNTSFCLVAILLSCKGQSAQETPQNTSNADIQPEKHEQIRVAANRTKEYMPFLKQKKVGVVANQTSVIFEKNGHTHLVDSLLNRGIAVKKVFSPEHGFRGKADAGEQVSDEKDAKTGLPIISLYGSHKKPTPADFKNIDQMVFDIQDVGVRFYTYISTLHYVMEACAENDVPLLILDRPNPNGNYTDGPVLNEKFTSFVGMHPVPIVHGMSIAEYAQMINGEKWLKNSVQCELKIVKVKNYSKDKTYSLPIKPSPNLPNDRAINLYPSLCFFEGTTVNAGRGTDQQFQVFGSPDLNKAHFPYQYTPQPNVGAKHPKNEGEICYGRNLNREKHLHKIELKWLIEAYKNTQNKADFFTAYFNKLAGTDQLKQQIKEGKSAAEISESWQSALEDYDKMRERYILY